MKLAAAFFLLVCSSATALAQAKFTAGRIADLQVGGGYTIANSDYTVNKIKGFAFYADYDFKEHFGIEVEFHQLHDPLPTKIYERTYEFGGRYTRTYLERYHPYGKLLYGRGVFNFPQDQANLAYNMLVAGGGVDVNVIPRLNVRVDYEYQRWLGFPPSGLAPTLLMFGAAYHFPPGKLAMGHRR